MAGLQKNNMQVFVAEVINPSSGVIRYEDAGEVKDFRANRFKGFPNGTTLRVVFSTSSSGRRWLMNASECDRDGNVIDKKQQRDEPERIEEKQPEASKPTPPPDPFEPEMVDGFYFDRQAKMLRTLVEKTIKSGDQNDSAFIWMKGASGYGKTTLPKKIAAAVGLDFLLVPCAMMSEPTEWFGMAVAKEGTTSFEYAEFSRAVERGNVLILLDEANRIKPWVANSLLQLLDDTRQTEVQGHIISVGPHVVFAMTTNIGYEYVGTDQIDAAFKNRVTATIEVGPLPFDIEVEIVEGICGSRVMATDVVQVITALRGVVSRLGMNVDVSTRTSKNIARLLKMGFALNDAFTVGVINPADPENRKALVDTLQSKLGS